MLKYYLVQAPVTAILGITSLGYVIATGLMFPHVPAILFLPWLFLPILLLLVFLPFRRRFRDLRTQYDIDRYHTAKAERVRMPGRFRRKRWLQTGALHIPSALAAFMVIFLPVATHAMRLGSDLRRSWSVSLPLTIAVFPDEGYEFGFFSTTGLGRYGMNFFVVQPPEFSEISIQPRIASTPSGTSPGRFVCDEQPWYGRVRIVCETASDRNGNALSIVFHGRAEDKQKVYEILEGIRPAHPD